MSGDSFSLTTHDDGPAPVLSVVGELDMEVSPQLRRRLVELTERHPETIIVDLSEVNFMDSSGLAVLSSIRMRIKPTGGRLVLVVAHPPVARLFQLSAMDKLFTIGPTRDEAIGLLAN
jgi:anti-sigma B factor antagonist